jgi:hypothetical protein
VGRGKGVAEGVERGLGGRIDFWRDVRARDRVPPIAKKPPFLQHRDIAAVELAKSGEGERPWRAQLAGAERGLRPPQLLKVRRNAAEAFGDRQRPREARTLDAVGIQRDGALRIGENPLEERESAFDKPVQRRATSARN